MTKSRIFFILSLSFIAGVGTASFYYPKIIGHSLLLISAAFAFILIVVFYKNKYALITGFSILFFIFGIFVANSKLEKLSHLDLDGKNIFERVVIAREPKVSLKTQKLILKNAKGDKFLANTGAFEDYKYGDNLDISCTLSIIKNDGLDFDYQSYLAKDGIYYECKKLKIEKTGTNSANFIYAFLLRIRNGFDANISKIIPFPQAGLLSGLILGGDDRLSDEIQKKFSATGMTHIVAVSGYNVTIIAEYLMIFGIFIGFWRRQAFWLAVTGIIIFIVAIGMPSSAVRAGVMGILLIWAIKNGRLANSQNAILFSANIMLMANPMLLRWDIGFQLSFLATLGIIYLYPVMENVTLEKIFGYFKNRKFAGARPIPIITEILFLTVSAQIFVMPIILFNFKNLSLVSIPANLLILPIIPITMMLGFLAGITGFISWHISLIFAWLAYLPLKYETLVIEYLADLKYASIEVGIKWWGVILWYIILVSAIYFLRERAKKQKWPIEKSS